jgi:inorganic pyrophosphatase
MFMEDEKGLDSKVVLSRTGPDGKPLHDLTGAVRREVGDYFEKYKDHEPGGFSTVPGWGSAAEGLAFVTTTHGFFKNCQGRAPTPCALAP